MDRLGKTWPFMGRAAELDLVRRSLKPGHRGMLVTGPPGTGKTRLATEAVSGTEHLLVAGSRTASAMPFAPFAELVPATASLQQAVQAMRPVSVLVVDDAHWLDDASVALIHHLAMHSRTRLLLLARQWPVGDLLPRLNLEPLSLGAAAHLLERVLGGPVDAPTTRRLHRACRGDLRLLRELVSAVSGSGRLTREAGRWVWRGATPLTLPVRELVATAVGPVEADEAEALERFAFGERPEAVAEPLLERLERKKLIVANEHGSVRVAHPLHGQLLREEVGRLRAVRLRRNRGTILEAECAELRALTDDGELRELPVGIGEYLAEEDDGWDEPLMPEFHALRARAARLRGEIREASGWSRDGLRRSPDHPGCLAELAHSAAYLGDIVTACRALGALPETVHARAWVLAAKGDLNAARLALTWDDDFSIHDAARLGAPGLAAARLRSRPGALAGLLAAHADALVAKDATALEQVADELEARGLQLHAAEAAAQAAICHHHDQRASRAARSHAARLAQACQGALTPALVKVPIGELTSRQLQIVNLAAAGLSNREIAEQLTISVRTVGNHLCAAYTRLGDGNRSRLSGLFQAAPIAANDQLAARMSGSSARD